MIVAGDSKPINAASLATPSDPELSDPFPGIQATLDGILDELRGVVYRGPSIFDIQAGGLIGFAEHDWQRLRVTHIVVSASAPGTAILNVGSFSRTWNIDLGTTPIPVPVTIERGADITLGGTAAGIVGYLIATPE